LPAKKCFRTPLWDLQQEKEIIREEGKVNNTKKEGLQKKKKEPVCQKIAKLRKRTGCFLNLLKPTTEICPLGKGERGQEDAKKTSSRRPRHHHFDRFF